MVEGRLSIACEDQHCDLISDFEAMSKEEEDEVEWVEGEIAIDTDISANADFDELLGNDAMIVDDYIENTKNIVMASVSENDLFA